MVLSCLFAVGFSIKAASLNDVINFNIDKDHDASARTEVGAVLVKISPKLYFFVEKKWWDQQAYAKQSEILNNFEILSQEFEKKFILTLLQYSALSGSRE